MTQVRIDIPQSRIDDFCRRWRIAELALFGSVLRDDFRPDSDVDVLIVFAEDARWDLFDWMAMKEELEGIFSRSVDLVSKAGLRNPFRRRSILKSLQVIYAA